MLFNSFTFLLLFLPLVLAGFYWLGQRFGRSVALSWLLLASVFYYAWWEWSYLWLLLGSLLGNYAAARWLEKATRGRAWIVWTTVAGNVLLLLYYKAIVAGLLGEDDTASAAFSTTQDVLIPLAISFMTFQQIAFVIDTYHGRQRCTGPLEYSLFITFFPQLVMGPIVHYRELVPQFRSPDLLRWCPENIALGLSIFIVGLFKKVVIADSIGPYVGQVYGFAATGGAVSPADAWAAAVGFLFQLYFDFSGYADMAVGLGRMFNINLPINFDSPFRAVDRFDMWRRWHVSFGAFMRQYLFFPLARSKRLRLGNLGALMITAMISGLWHGLGATFILWGGLQALIMAVIHYRGAWLARLGLKRRPGHNGFPWLAMIWTFTVTVLLGVFFRANEMAVAFTMFDAMYDGLAALASGAAFSAGGPGRLLEDETLRNLILMAIVIWGLPTTQRFFGGYWSAIDQRASGPTRIAPDLLPGAGRLRFAPTRAWAAVMALLLLTALLSMDGANRFIYYQF